MIAPSDFITRNDRLAAATGPQGMSDAALARLQRLLAEASGITLGSNKRVMACGRLQSRLRALGLTSYDAYVQRLGVDAVERRRAVDLLTTNETYFFREPKHFEYLANDLLPRVDYGCRFRIWSAACSTGEEPYSLAMVLGHRLGKRPWEVVASDLSDRVLETARKGIYPLERAERIPRDYLRRFCRKGVGRQEGTFCIEKHLRSRVRFEQVNLTAASLLDLGRFDVIFLRNVLIYFDGPTKNQVVARLSKRLVAGGHLIVGHAEGLSFTESGLVPIAPSIYRKQEV